MISRSLWLLFLVIAAAVVKSAPVAIHQLASVKPAGDMVLRLQAYDTVNPNLVYTITSLPTSGSLYQLSQVFSAYGRNPKAGTKITTVPVNVTGSNNRVYYKRPSPDHIRNVKWDSFNFMATSTLINNGAVTTSSSYEGTVTIVPDASQNALNTKNNGAIIGSDFLLNNEGWKIVGNKPSTSGSFAVHEPYSRGNSLNYYIMGSDDAILMKTESMSSAIMKNTNEQQLLPQSSVDSHLWYFEAPAKFHGHFGISYGGNFEFTLGFFAGDLTSTGKMNSLYHTPAVVLECAQCQGPISKGITLIYPLVTLLQKHRLSTLSENGGGTTTTFTIPLLESSGWVKDPQNSLVSPYPKASQCDMIQVLSALSNIRILGDWSQWYETVALDNVLISNTQIPGKVPVCALGRPDASVCTCN